MNLIKIEKNLKDLSYKINNGMLNQDTQSLYHELVAFESADIDIDKTKNYLKNSRI